jgi:hypothetical protein
MRYLLILSLAAAASWAAAALAQDSLPAYSTPEFPLLFDEPDAVALVDAWYQKYLGRPAATDSGSSYWVNQLVQGKRPFTVLTSILSSQEFFESGPTTSTGFINHLFASVLGRQPTGQESEVWVKQALLQDIQDNELRRNLIFDFLSNYRHDADGQSIVFPGAVGQRLQQNKNDFNLNRPYYPYQL